MKHLFTLLLIFSFTVLQSQTLCENGYAGTYPCNNVDLLYFMNPGEFGDGTTNEVWGWTDPLYGTEYVLLGKSNGTAFIDITNPLDPLYLGTLPPHAGNSTWRSLRTYNNYLFTVSEAANSGMQVFDLTRLRDVLNPPVVFTEDAWYGGFGRCHSLAICEETGFAYGCGSQTYAGGPHIINIQNPLAPVIAGGFDEDGYTHEAVVVVYDGPDTDYIGHTIAFCFNGNNPVNLTIADLTDPSDPEPVSITGYTGGEYCHQGWLTPDGAYMLMDDELDEYGGPYTSTRTLIWNMQNLDAPVYMGDFLGTTTAIDHNQMIVGNLNFQSNYTAGLRIIDITNIATLNLSEVAFFDHFPYNDSPQFDGTWMNYPFFESGIIPVTDIDYGLFLVKANFLHLDSYSSEACSAGSSLIEMNVAEGFSGPINFSASGLPAGASASFSTNGVTAPATVELTISNLETASGDYIVTVTAQGQYFTYTRDYHLQITAASNWYPDLDADGFGDGNPLPECAQPVGYSNNDLDCNDANAGVHPGAAGTHLNQDNDCNGIVEGDEVLCPDFTNDGIINITDLLIFMSYYGCFGVCIGDIDNNGAVNAGDLLMFMSVFGDLCE